MSEDVSPHLLASVAIQSYARRFAVAVSYVRAASTARVELPLEEGIPAIMDGLVGYLLEGENALLDAQRELEAHRERVARYERVCARVRELEEALQQEQIPRAVARMTQAYDDLQSIDAARSGLHALRDAAMEKPDVVECLIEASERYGYTRAPLSAAPIFGADGNLVASALDRQPLLPWPSASGIRGSTLVRWQSTVTAATPVHAMAPRAAAPQEAAEEDMSKTVDVPMDLDTTTPALTTGTVDGEAVEEDVPVMEEVVPPAAVLSAATPVQPTATALPASQGVAIATASQVPATAASAASARPAAGLSLPPALLAKLQSLLPPGWKPGDPLPANLPDIRTLLRR